MIKVKQYTYATRWQARQAKKQAESEGHRAITRRLQDGRHQVEVTQQIR